MTTLLQAEVQADDIVVQGVSMTELITYHFVDKEMQLSDEEYWKGFQKFTTYLEVAITSAMCCCVKSVCRSVLIMYSTQAAN